MSGWLPRLVIAAIASVGMGAIAAGTVAAWTLYRVEEGRNPETGGLHVREGHFWNIARDDALGVRWVNIERVPHPSSNGALSLPGIPRWAEPRDAGPQARGEWRVGTLAVGWPWPMVARQWSETEPDRLFVPHAEVDDDGLTIAKMARHFVGTSRSSQWFVLWPGVMANTAAFAVFAFVVLLPRALHRDRHLNRREVAARQLGSG